MKKAQVREILDEYIQNCGGQISWSWNDKKGVEAGIFRTPKLEIQIELMKKGYIMRMLRPRDKIGNVEDLYDHIPGIKSVVDKNMCGLESDILHYEKSNKAFVVIDRLNRCYKLAGILGEGWSEKTLEQFISKESL